MTDLDLMIVMVAAPQPSERPIRTPPLATMDLVRRLAAQGARTDADPEDVRRAKGKDRWPTAWRRMALRLLWATMAAATAAVVEAWDRIAERKLEEARRRNPELTTKERTATPNKVKKSNMVRPMAKGQPLPRSKAGKPRMEPEDCPHAEDRLQARGGRSGEGSFLWLTCLDCGSRWTRLDSEGRQMMAAPALSIMGPPCPCGKTMTMKTNTQDDSFFWGCPAYPQCTRTLKIKAEDLQKQAVKSEIKSEPAVKSEPGAASSKAPESPMTGWEIPMEEPESMEAETPASQAIDQLVVEMRRRIGAGKPRNQVIEEIMSSVTSAEEALLVAQAAGKVGI